MNRHILFSAMVIAALAFAACSADDNISGITPSRNRVGYSAWHTQVSYTPR